MNQVSRRISLWFTVAAGLALVFPARGGSEDTQTYRFVGTVVDSHDQPVAGAVIFVYQPDVPVPMRNGDLVSKRQTTADSNGAFEVTFDRTVTTIVAQKPGLAPAWQMWSPQIRAGANRFVLAEPAVLAGTLVDESDHPVAGAEVFVSMTFHEMLLENGARTYAYLHGEPARQLFNARTDTDGHFRILNFPTNGMADLGVHATGKVLRESRRDHISPDTMSWRAGQQDVRLVVDPAGTIDGRVIVPEGKSAAEARLRLELAELGYSRQTETVHPDTKGTFRFTEVAAGSYRLRTDFGINKLPDLVAETVSFAVGPGESVKGIEVRAVTGGLLQVTVVNRGDRQPVSQATVSAYRSEFLTAGVTGGEGTALLRLPPGDYQLSANKDQARATGASVKVEADQTNRVTIELVPPPTIAGIVRDSSGAPLPDVQMTVFPGYGMSRGTVKTDANGHYEILWNPRSIGGSGRTFCLIAREMSRNLAVAKEIDESTTTMDLSLEPGLVIAGRVENPEGKGLTKATGYLILWSGNMGSQFGEPFRADADGRFEISALPQDRRYSVFATAKGYGSVSQQVAREDSETNRIELPAFALRVADRRLAGRVVDAEEKPVAGVRVSMYGQGQPNDSVTTDENGNFAFGSVCEGQVQVYASARQSYGNTRAEAGDTNIVITLGVQTSVYQEAPRRVSLKGKPLPDLTAVGFSADAVPAGKSVLLGLLDVEQRPSRRFVRLLADRHEALQQMGITVLGLQTAVLSDHARQGWKESNPVPFPIGWMTEKSDKTRWATEVSSLPWLILTDAQGRVAAEGFALDELDAKIEALGK